MSGNGYGWVDVSATMIRDLLHAPPDSDIIDAQFRRYAGVVKFLFASPELSGTADSPSGVVPTVEVVPGGFVWSWGEQS